MLRIVYFQSTIRLASSTVNGTGRRSKTHERLKRTLFHWTKQDKMCEFSRKSSFSKLRTE